MELYTLREASHLLEGQISLDALRKRTQNPDSKASGIRSVLGADGKRRIPRHELERHFRITSPETEASKVIQQLSAELATKERELAELRQLPEKIETERAQLLEAEKAALARAQVAEERSAAAEAQAQAWEAWKSELSTAGWIRRRKLLRAPPS
jgi:vacuolar-type H+-ATPase subunit I/STV1